MRVGSEEKDGRGPSLPANDSVCKSQTEAASLVCGEAGMETFTGTMFLLSFA